tara:strand:+ start:1730 stop:2404 length:675 start_codon:yes stop_codon:yes gene_type:complete
MITIVIPTINEEKNIIETLSKILNTKELKEAQIIIVDDGSKDETINNVKTFKNKMHIKIIENNKKLGLGLALKNGFDEASFSHVLFLDADLSVEISDILKMIKYRKKNTILIGSRYLDASKIIGANYIKIKISYFLNFLISKFYNLGIIDISHSFRIICKNIKLQSLNYTHPGFFWEITINSKKNGVHLEEIPITFTERKFGVSKNKSYKMFLSILKSMFNLIK